MASSRRRRTAPGSKFRAGELRTQVLLLQRLDRIPVELEFLGDILDVGLATASPRVAGKAFAVEGADRQEAGPPPSYP